ncbi:MAG: NADH-quinone oxidoreductase subunit H, partial [Opitutales bacterium]|nr:NADH-quinone oxidoreductase subunit H [Opitutales bacterium]
IPFGIFWLDNKSEAIAVANLDISLVFALAIGSLGVFGGIMAGWSSNSKLPYIGAMRAAAQVVSYELAMGLSVLPVILMVASKGVDSPMSLFEISKVQSDNFWFCFTQPISALIFLVALFAETNRLPFDMAESETDIVSGYHTEYGSFKFGLFFVGEYGHIVVGSAIFISLFLGGWNPIPCESWPQSWGIFASILSVVTFLVKIAMMIFFFIWIRWTLPRFRNDQVMNLGWKCLLPLAVANFVFYLIYTSIGSILWQ